jgi:hypothetical protein
MAELEELEAAVRGGARTPSTPAGSPAGYSKPKKHGRGKNAYFSEPRPLTEYQKYIKAHFHDREVAKGREEAQERVKELAEEWAKTHPEAGRKKKGKKPPGNETICQKRKALKKAAMFLTLKELHKNDLFDYSCQTPAQKAATAKRSAEAKARKALAKSLGKKLPKRGPAKGPKKLTVARAREIIAMFGGEL